MVLFGGFVLFLNQTKWLFCEPYQQFHSTLGTPFRKEENTPSSGYATSTKRGSAYVEQKQKHCYICACPNYLANNKYSGKKQKDEDKTEELFPHKLNS